MKKPAPPPPKNDTQVLDISEAPAQSFGKFLMTALADKDIPVEKLQLLLTMRQQMLAEQSKEAFQTAFARFSAALPVVGKDGWIDLGAKGKIPFTSMEEINRVVRPGLTENGLSLQFITLQEANGRITVTGKLMGWGYERESSLSAMPDRGPGRDEVQAVGSTVSKLSRYIALGLCNLVRGGPVIEANSNRPHYEELDDYLNPREARDGE